MTDTFLLLVLCLLTIVVPVACALGLAAVVNKVYEDVTMRGHVK